MEDPQPNSSKPPVDAPLSSSSSTNPSSTSTTPSPSPYRKPCSLCHTPRDVLIRCQIDEAQKWHFVCTGKCWKAVSGGVVDGDGDEMHKWYRYGGMWKNKHEAVSAKIKGKARVRNREGGGKDEEERRGEVRISDEKRGDETRGSQSESESEESIRKGSEKVDRNPSTTPDESDI